MSNINLLPDEIKEDIAQAKKNKKTRKYFVKSILMLFSVILFSGVLFLYLQSEIKRTARDLEIKNSDIENFGNLEAEATVLSKRLATIGNIKDELNHWSDTIKELRMILPSGSYLTSVSIEEDKKARNRLSGFADSKAIVASIRNSMEKSEKFEYVDIESSSSVLNPISQEFEENFIITFSLSKDALERPKDD